MSKSPSDSQKRRIANQLLFKRMNEHYQSAVAKIVPDSDIAPALLEFVCECSDVDCTERVELSLASYKRIHDTTNRYVINRGHEQMDVDDIITKTDSYFIVAKRCPEKT